MTTTNNKTNNRRCNANKPTTETTTLTNKTATTTVVAVPLSELTTAASLELIQASIANIEDAATLLHTWHKFSKANKSGLFKDALSSTQLSAVKALISEKEAKAAAEKEAEQKAIEAAEERVKKAAEARAEKAAEESEKALNAAIDRYFELLNESTDGLPRIMSTSTALQPLDYPDFILVRGKISVSARGIETHKTLLLPISGFRSPLSVMKDVFRWFAAAQYVADANKTVLTDKISCAFPEETTRHPGSTDTKKVTIGGYNPFLPFLQGHSLEFIDSETGKVTRIECETTFAKTTLRDAGKVLKPLKATKSKRGRKFLWKQIVSSFLASCRTLRAIHP